MTPLWVWIVYAALCGLSVGYLAGIASRVALTRRALAVIISHQRVVSHAYKCGQDSVNGIAYEAAVSAAARQSDGT